MNVKKSVFIAFRIILGIVFLTSGIGKAMDSKSFSILISDYGFHNLSALSPLIIIFETALGIALILRVRLKEVIFLTTLTLVLFTGLYSYAYLFKGITDCGCFGSLMKPISPKFFYLKNVVLLIFSLVLYQREKNNNKTGKFRRNLFFVVVLLITYLTGFSYNNPIIATKAVTPVVFKDMELKNTKLNRLIEVHKDSTYMVFLYSYTCSYCLNSMKKIDEYKQTKAFDKLILIGSGSEAEKELFYKSHNIKDVHIDISKKEIKEIVNYYPRTFFIKNNTIVDEMIGELPSVLDSIAMNALKKLD